MSAPVYKELVDIVNQQRREIDSLQARLNEMKSQYLWIKRKPLSSAPSSIPDGEIVPVDTGSAFALYWQTSDGIKSTSFS